MASRRAAAHDEAIDKEQDDGADDGADETRRLSGDVQYHGLPEIRRNERADDPQNSRQDEALRLGLVARHDKLGNHSDNEANDNRPKDVHLTAPPEPPLGTTNMLRAIASRRS